MAREPSREAAFRPRGGWPFVGLCLLLLAATVYAYWQGGRLRSGEWIAAGVVLTLLDAFVPIGFFIVPPNVSRVLVLFGRYRGTVRENGFFWTNPFTLRHRVSLRARNLDTDVLKVNDSRGSPVEIAAVVVWRVEDTARAVFDVDNYEEYVQLQCESAVRQLASHHPYDEPEEGQLSLRQSREELAVELQGMLQERLHRAGVEVLEARLTHLAYAPEIAGAMLRRQQADAVIAARKKIVEGAVGMVEMALARLQAAGVMELDEERRAAMVSNLMVVLCGEQSAQPVVNTGSLYT